MTICPEYWMTPIPVLFLQSCQGTLSSIKTEGHWVSRSSLTFALECSGQLGMQL